jgi:3-dehydroquinate synthase
MDRTEIVPVDIGGRAYDIHVGANLAVRAGDYLAPMAKGVVPVVTDSNVAALHLAKVVGSLQSAGLTPVPMIFPAGESSKSFAQLEKLCGHLLQSGVGRDGLVVALGGGVVGDLTGFAAGILKRGISFVQIPTTLLAQVDSSVGGKTAINTAQGKNLVGLFHQPRLVLIDTTLLETLPARQMRAGYAEVVKYGALGDAGFFSWLENNGAKALAGDTQALTHMVTTSCRMKAAIVARDELETGERALLNLGHTFGHALEAEMGYSDRLLHGEAVAIGMVQAFRLSASLGLCDPKDAARLVQHLQDVGLPTDPRDLPSFSPSPDILIAHMAHDKKVHDGRLTFILANGLGKALISRDVPIDAVRAILSSAPL